MMPDLYWIEGPWKGKLAISARPRGGDWLADEVAGWRRAGVGMVVSLLESEEERDLALQEEKREVEAAGIQYGSFPIVDRGVPDSVRTMVQVLEEVKQELVAGRNVAVHCRQGIGRSGLVAAGLLMVSGISAAEALGMVRVARGVDVPETAQQRAWVEGLLVEHLALVRH